MEQIYVSVLFKVFVDPIKNCYISKLFLMYNKFKNLLRLLCLLQTVILYRQLNNSLSFPHILVQNYLFSKNITI